MNYAFSNRRQMSTDNYNKQNLSAGATFAMNNDLSLGYEFLLKNMNLSNVNDRAMRQLFDSVSRQFGRDRLTDFSTPHWMPYLGQFDWNKELYSMTPGMRNDENRFGNPRARWVPF